MSKISTNPPPSTLGQLIHNYIHTSCDGNILYLISDLDDALYMLHFIDNESFTQSELQNICYALKGLRECFMLSYFQQQGWYYKELDAWFYQYCYMIYF